MKRALFFLGISFAIFTNSMGASAAAAAAAASSSSSAEKEQVELVLQIKEDFSTGKVYQYYDFFKLSDPPSNVLRFLQSTSLVQRTGVQLSMEDILIKDYVNGGLGGAAPWIPLKGTSIKDLPLVKLYPEGRFTADLYFTAQAFKRLEAGLKASIAKTMDVSSHQAPAIPSVPK